MHFYMHSYLHKIFILVKSGCYTLPLLQGSSPIVAGQWSSIIAEKAPPCHRHCRPHAALLHWWGPDPVNLPGKLPVGHSCSSSLPPHASSAGPPIPDVPPSKRQVWWSPVGASTLCPWHAPALGHMGLGTESGPILFMDFLDFLIFHFPNRNSRNSFKILKCIENEIRLRKIENKFPWNSCE
jgi:hypothetical protein